MIKPNFYKQGDRDWTGYSWRGATVARNGCGPSAIANAISVLDKLGHKKATPLSAFKWLCSHGYMHPTYGTYYSGVAALLKAYGVKKVIHSSNFSTLKKHLKKGDFAICLPGRSIWTSSGHYILAYGMEGDKVLISDSASSSSERQKNTFAKLKAAIKAHPYPQFWVIDNTAQYVSDKKVTNKIAKHAIKRAKENHKYKKGGWSWTDGIECHAFVAKVHKECDREDVYKIIHDKEKFYKHYNDESYLGKYRVDFSKKKAGDIIATSYIRHHTGIYVGNGKVAEAVKKGTRVAKVSKDFKYAYRVPAKKSSNEKPKKSQGVKMVKGFDVSFNQRKLTLDGFKKAKKAGWEFVIIRIGGWYPEGKLYFDEEFNSKYEKAIKAGLKVGIYFYSHATSISIAEKEAKFTLEKLADRPLQYPIFIDFENPKKQAKLGKRLSKQICEAFCKVIEKAGYDAGVYSFYSWLNNNIDPISDKYYVWLAQYNDKDTYKGRHEMWQHSSSGTVPGIGYPIDVNVSQIPFGSYPVKKASKSTSEEKKPTSKITYPTLPKRGYFQKGDKGVNVKRLQTLLKKLEFYSGELDGIFGEKTLVGVKAFQRKYASPVDGLFGKKSLIALKIVSVKKAIK